MDPQNQQVPMGAEKSKSIGPVIGLIVILTLILLGGIYFYTSRDANNETPIPVEPDGGIGNTPEEQSVNAADIEAQSSSDETTAIEADLQATDMTSLDSDMSELQ